MGLSRASLCGVPGWVLVLQSLYWSINGAKYEGLHIGLHAQVSPSQGFVVGSVITTRGLSRAFSARPEVDTVKTFYPFEYEELHEHAWDLVIIEGWFEMINSFIHEVRALSPHVIVLFYCLDPDFPGLDTIKALDVDGYLTNSRFAEGELSSVAPTQFLMLAADPDMPSCTAETAGKYRVLNDKVVFVGSAVGMSTKAHLPNYLRHAAQAQGLAIMGSGWGDVPEFAAYWHGILPQEDLCCAYQSALAILGVTMDGQRLAGMINNRVFEALACAKSGQARFLSDPFTELEHVFGRHIRFLNEDGDVERHLAEIREGNFSSHHANISTIDLIRRQHSYDQRVNTILDFVHSTVFSPAHRPNKLHILILHEVGLLEEIEYQLSLGPTLATLEAKGHYRFTWKAVPPLQAQAQGGAADDFSAYDAIWGVGGFSGAADRYIRAVISPPGSTPRGLIQRRALILWGDPPTLPTPADQDAILTYDVVMYASEYDRVLLSSAVRHPNLQHAYGIQAPTSPPPKTCLPPSDAGVNISSTTDEQPSPPVRLPHNVVVLLGPAAPASPPLPFSNATSVTLACLLPACPPSSPPSMQPLSTLSSLAGLLNTSPTTSLSITGPGLPLWALVGVAAIHHRHVRDAALDGHDVAPVRMWNVDDRVLETARIWPTAWDVEYYASRLVAAMTRALCLGRGGSHVSITSPSNYTLLPPAARHHLRIGTLITDFTLGREGSVCLFLCRRLLVCVQREHIDLRLDITPPLHRPLMLELQAELRSNMYRDIIATSAPVYVVVAASEPQVQQGSPEQHGPAHPLTPLPEHTIVYYRLDLTQPDAVCLHAF